MFLPKRKTTSLLLLIFWMAIIAAFSHTPNLNLGSDSIPLEIIARKFAHLAEYFILAFLFYNFLRLNFPRAKKQFFNYSFLFVLVFAAFDEIHQSFIVGRSGRIEDVIFDLFSGTLGIFLIDRVKFFCKYKRKQPKERRP